MPTRSRLVPDVLIIFVGFWLAYGAGINNLNVQSYSLHPLVVTQLADHGTFVLGHAEVPKESDSFLFEGKVLPAKQPGIFALGAAAYALCSRLGLTYERDYLLTGAVVTWLTAALLAALAGACWFLLAVAVWGFKRSHALAGVMACGFCTTLLPYSGIPHHDIVAAAFVVMALLALETARAAGAEEQQASPRRTAVTAAIGGALLGMSLTTSFLPVAIVFGLGVAILATRRIAIVAGAAVGFIAGLAPLGLYNLHYFHDPLVQANMAGGYDDTYPGFAAGRALDHLNDYLGTGDVSVVKYMPVLVLGLVGLAFFGSVATRPRRLLPGLLILHGLYVLSIPAIGYCQYGPRFLIPAVPLAMLGFPALLERVAQERSSLVRRSAAVVIASIAVYSFAVNVVGVLGGTMYCPIERFAFPSYVAILADPRTWREALPLQFPLFLPCLAAAAALAAVLLGRRFVAARRAG